MRPLHIVRKIEQMGSGYQVDFNRIVNGRLVPGSALATHVILAAGSLGSTELLLRCRDEFGTLPNVGSLLGRNWSSNGDFLTPAFYDRDVNPTQGPTITCAIDFLDGSFQNEQFWIEDGGFPDVLDNWLQSRLDAGGGGRFAVLLRELRQVMERGGAVKNIMAVVRTGDRRRQRHSLPGPKVVLAVDAHAQARLGDRPFRGRHQRHRRHA